MTWQVTPSHKGHGLVVRYSEPGHDTEVFVLPIVAWRIDETGFGEAVVATQDSAQAEDELARVGNWTVLGYHMPPFLPHPEVGK